MAVVSMGLVQVQLLPEPLDFMKQFLLGLLMNNSNYTQLSLFTQDDGVSEATKKLGIPVNLMKDNLSSYSSAHVDLQTFLRHMGCIACGGTGRSSKGRQCIPCRVNHQKSVSRLSN